jgi:acyl-CoA dehydrogenase
MAAEPGTTAFPELRAEVRAFLREQIELGIFSPGVDAWLTEWNTRFTSALAERGWVGMTIPAEYGGHGRPPGERFAVTEELVAAGAPVGAHWVADRQIAPSILRFGAESLKRLFLPAIANGKRTFCIGMSEPDSGSDLSSVRAKAVPVDGGWTITGRKVWTSNAHRANSCVVLARTAPFDLADRHAGLSQFVLDLPSPGVTVIPIRSASGEHHFNEVVFDEAFVPADRLLGREGGAWLQLTAELGFERSGPERFLSTLPLLSQMIGRMRRREVPVTHEAGQLVARLAGLRSMSLAVGEALQRGEQADTAAAVVKVLGATTEGDIAELADLLGHRTDQRQATREYDELVRTSLLRRPGFTLRGGTNEILRGVIARGLGMR